MLVPMLAGSSPRVWGQERRSVSYSIGKRIIPTRVGTSLRVLSTWIRSKDHPHACGDKNIAYSLIPSIKGSSPRVWGQVETVLNDSWDKRIIPTRVGTRRTDEALRNPRRDHPHACGDKHHIESRLNIGKGSSPRVWGQEDGTVVTAVDGRIIPTRVGTRAFRSTANKRI